MKKRENIRLELIINLSPFKETGILKNNKDDIHKKRRKKSNGRTNRQSETWWRCLVVINGEKRERIYVY